VFRSTARNFNPDCAKAAKICIAEVEELVEAGQIPPDQVHLPGLYVHRIIHASINEKRIEKVRFSETADSAEAATAEGSQTQAMRDRIGRRAAKEFKDGMYVNLGIGIPTLASNNVPPGIKVTLQSENGKLMIVSQIFLSVCHEAL
jgi:3-oxoacid CoA-transferase